MNTSRLTILVEEKIPIRNRLELRIRRETAVSLEESRSNLSAKMSDRVQSPTLLSI
jgi:hypothetical protein